MIFPQSTFEERKNRTHKALSSILGNDDVVLVFAGTPVQKPGGHDQTYSFLPHPDYFWLTGSRRPAGVSCFTKAEGWIDFMVPVGRDEKIWEGGNEVVTGKDIAGFSSWLAQHNKGKVFLIGQFYGHEKLSSASPEARAELQEVFSEVRRVKDRSEIELITNIALMASHGYAKLSNFIKPGVTERQIQLAYESEVLARGAEKMPYDSIVGTGTNSAILHAIPTNRVVGANDMVLIDAGGDIQDYCVDITRVYPASGKFTDRQQVIYNLVKEAQTESIKLCRPGTEWKDVHLASARVMARGLKELGILNVGVDEALESGAVGCFFPHGVGHMVGLRVRDVGGTPNPNPKKYAGARLRVDMKLSEGYLMTVEPGLYFIEALLNDAQTRSDFKTHINWNEIEKWLDLGGVRIEDDIHITKEGPVNLTASVAKL